MQWIGSTIIIYVTVCIMSMSISLTKNVCLSSDCLSYSLVVDINQKLFWGFVSTAFLFLVLIIFVGFIKANYADYNQCNRFCSERMYICLSRPGVLKDLKTMGSVSLFIFFITLLVLARQVCISLRLLWLLLFPLSCPFYSNYLHSLDCDGSVFGII